MIGDIYMSIEVNGITHSISISGEHGNEWTKVSPSDLDMARNYIDNIIEIDNNRERSAIDVPGHIDQIDHIPLADEFIDDDGQDNRQGEGEGWATIEQLVDPNEETNDEPTGQVEQVGYAKSQYDTTEDIEVNEDRVDRDNRLTSTSNDRNTWDGM